MSSSHREPHNPPVSGHHGLLRRAGPLVAARLLSAVLTAAIPLVLARQLSLHEYGTYKTVFLVAMTLYSLLPFGVSQSLYFFVPRHPDSARTYFGHAMVWLFGMSLLGSGVLFAFEEELARWLNNPDLLTYKWQLQLYTAGLLASSPLELWFTSRGKTRLSALSYLASDGLRALVLVVPVLLGFGLRGALTASAGFAVLRLLTCWLVLLQASGGAIFSPRLFLTQLTYAAPFGAAMLLSASQQSAHQFAVASLVSPELFAIYAVGVFQLPLVDLLYTPTSEVLMVRIGELEKQQRLDLALDAFREATSKLALIFLPMVAFFFAAAPEFIATCFGTKFLPAVPIFRVGIWSIALASLPVDGVLRARNRTREIFWSYLVKTVATAVLVYALVPRYGMMGGVCSWLLAELIGKAMLLMYVPRALSAPGASRAFRDVIPSRHLLHSALAAVVAASMVVLARSLVPLAEPYTAPDSLAWRAVALSLAAALFLSGYLAVLSMQGIRPLAAFMTRVRGGAA
jgi:O-antigen/teichoic acid export membrane protein